MSNSSDHIFSTRPTTTLLFPQKGSERVLHPEQVILRFGDKYYDIGSFCYTLRSSSKRKSRESCEVVLGSFLKQRRRQVLQLIKALSRLVNDGGKSIFTALAYAKCLKSFVDWADASGLTDCLAGGDATRQAYRLWAEDTRERYGRQDFGACAHNQRIRFVRELLEAATGLNDLQLGIRMVKLTTIQNCATDPLAPHDFAHAVALNQALFEGLCELVLERRSFPYKLILPESLGWAENCLWIFPVTMWRLPPHKWGVEREKLTLPHWAYDYAAGRLAKPEEIEHRYTVWRYPSEGRKLARRHISNAQAFIDAANGDERAWSRIMLGMIAHDAFLFLFFCNTGANESVVQRLETVGDFDVATNIQGFRSIKLRAGGKLVVVNVPLAFMPLMRSFMALRHYLLNGADFPLLFFTLGSKNKSPPRRIPGEPLGSLYSSLLRTIDPKLPRMGPRVLRASVADWYQRHHDASVTSKVLHNLEQTVQRHYDAGSAIDHRQELSLLLNSISEAARRQRVVATKGMGVRSIEEGGCCDSFGHPEALAAHPPIAPNCKSSQGCLFCTHRVLVACEEDARKIASAAFVMEQVVLGPKHEAAMRPLIEKCDADLEKIAAFKNCRTMVKRVRKDVFENGSLTPFFADKYQLFLELGVIA
ncbi:MAG TPA: hypothetical protein VLC92_14240 [Rhodocyclaceae bacterium]|nr:hypothetical protein [Rhodocyclaceae bacterium]